MINGCLEYSDSDSDLTGAFCDHGLIISCIYLILLVFPVG